MALWRIATTALVARVSASIEMHEQPYSVHLIYRLDSRGHVDDGLLGTD